MGGSSPLQPIPTCRQMPIPTSAMKAWPCLAVNCQVSGKVGAIQSSKMTTQFVHARVREVSLPRLIGFVWSQAYTRIVPRTKDMATLITKTGKLHVCPKTDISLPHGRRLGRLHASGARVRDGHFIQPVQKICSGSCEHPKWSYVRQAVTPVLLIPTSDKLPAGRPIGIIWSTRVLKT